MALERDMATFRQAVERVIDQLQGVIASRVTLNGSKEIAEVHVLANYDRSPKQLVRDIITKADVVAMHTTTGNPPLKVIHSRYSPNHPDREVILTEEFYPKEAWLEKSVETLTMIITIMEKGMIWGNCHACLTCELRNKCTG